MTLPVYPAALPYNPVDFSIVATGRGSITSEMNAGNRRQRRRGTVDIGQVSLAIEMTIAQFESFVTFHKSELGLGASRFTMPVWNGRAWPVKTVQIQPDGRYGFARVGAKMRVSLQLDVEDL